MTDQPDAVPPGSRTWRTLDHRRRLEIHRRREIADGSCAGLADSQVPAAVLAVHLARLLRVGPALTAQFRGVTTCRCARCSQGTAARAVARPDLALRARLRIAERPGRRRCRLASTPGSWTPATCLWSSWRCVAGILGVWNGGRGWVNQRFAGRKEEVSKFLLTSPTRRALSAKLRVHAPSLNLVGEVHVLRELGDPN